MVVGYDVSGKDIATDASTCRLDTAQGTEVLQKEIKTPLQKNLLNPWSLLRMPIMLTLHLILKYHITSVRCIVCMLNRWYTVYSKILGGKVYVV